MTTLTQVPELLNMPEKMRPMISKFNDYRYLLAEGGRGGSKSQSIARFLLFLGDKYNLRIVCGRETQNSIAESVYSVFTDLIRNYDLNSYEIQATRILHRHKKTIINFRGFREQGAFNIQGMEGIDIVWIDEAQALTKQTLDVLIPTIRKPKSKIIFSMNRHVYNDPAYQFADRDDCLHININFDDNPYCPDVLLKEAEECRKLSERDYNHIWLGKPLDQSENSVFGLTELNEASQMKYRRADGYGLRIAGYDIARYGDDKCAAYIIQQMGALHWEEIFVDEWDKRDLHWTTGRILEIHNEYKCDYGIIDEDGLGSGPLDTLNKGRGILAFEGFRNLKLAYQNNKDYANVRTLNTYKLKKMTQAGHIGIFDEKTREELLGSIKYTFDANHRRILLSKEVMKKPPYSVPSPNRADALIMAVSKIGEVKRQQAVEYEKHTQPAYSREDNLFNLSGVR